MKLSSALLLASLVAACGDNLDLGPQVTSSHVSSTVGEDGSVTVTIAVADPEGLTFTPSAPAHGTLSGTGPTFTYHPNAEFSGHDSFVVTVSDGEKSVEVPVYLVIESINDAPIATDDAFATPEDMALSFPVSAILANDRDIDSQRLVVTAVTQPDAMLCAAPGCGQPTVVLADDMITYTPPYNFNGDQTFQYTLSDGALTTTGTVTISVGAVNDAPWANGDLVQGREDVAAVIPMADLLANDWDADGDTPMVISVGDALHGSVAIQGTDVIFTPDAEYSGPAAFAYTISDGMLESSATVSLVIAVVDDAPVVADATLSTHMNHDASFTLTGTDIDSASLTFAIVAQPAHGTISGTSPTFTYTPDSGYSGDDSFTFAASDGTSSSVPATMHVTIIEDTSILHYTFDGTGTTVANAGLAGVDGTLVGNATMGGAGVCGSALLSDGTSTSYVDTNWDLALPGSWTLAFWSSGNHASSFYVIGEATTSFRVFTNGVAGPNNWILRGNGITDTYINNGANGSPHMMAWVYSASLGTITGYLDGVQVSSVTQAPLSLAGGKLRIGAYTSGAGLSASATMDDVRLYGEALDAAAVMDMYTASQVCPL